MKKRVYLGSCTPPKKYGGETGHKSIGGRYRPIPEEIEKYDRMLSATTGKWVCCGLDYFFVHRTIDGNKSDQKISWK